MPFNEPGNYKVDLYNTISKLIIYPAKNNKIPTVNITTEPKVKINLKTATLA